MSDDPEEKAARLRRAREVIDGADWLFREHAANCTNAWINSDPLDTTGREEAFRQLRAVADLKAILIGIINTAENDEALRGRISS